MAPSALASNSNSSNLLKVSGQTATPTHNNNHTTNQLTVELISSNLVKKSTMKRNRSENQLTWMTIAVAVLYSAVLEQVNGPGAALVSDKSRRQHA